MVRPRHAAGAPGHTARFPPIHFVVLCVLVAGCVGRSQASPGGQRAPTEAAAQTAGADPTPLPTDPNGLWTADPAVSPSPSYDPAVTDAFRSVTAIGDSLMVDASPNLRSVLPGLTIDAVAGRQVAVGLTEMQQLAWNGRLGSTVVFALGTNGPFSLAQFTRVLNLANGRHLVMLTNHCDYCAWVPANNAMIRAQCWHARNCTVADWATLAAAHAAWFYSDGVHLPIGGIGGEAYALLVSHSLPAAPPTPRRVSPR